MTVPTRPDVLAVLAPGSLEGRTALVTGGGSGIGRASALLLSRLGADVRIVGRTQDSLDETVRLAVEAGTRAITTSVCDVREPEEVDTMLEGVLADLGRIDILLNNAGGQFVSPGELVPYKGFRAVTRLNLDATWYLTARVAERSMLPNGYGKIISITMSPHRGTPGMAHSSAARAAVESLTRTLAVEWGPRGVRLVAIAPGFVHTEAIAKYGIDPDVLGSIVPVPRMQAADEVAALVGFLAGPAGDYITGTTITADGGLDVVGPGILS